MSQLVLRYDGTDVPYDILDHSSVTAWVDIQSQNESSVVAQLGIMTDDVNRYDEHSRDNIIFGTCEFKRGQKSEMWGP